MPNILLTGVVTLDIINSLNSYPKEDSEVRALSQTLRSGGNACNSAIVMQQLGLNTSLLASRADDSSASHVFNQLHQRHIDTSLCVAQKNSCTPTSYVTLNTANGSRTIVHYRKLEELSAKYFKTIKLTPYDWLHFEVRNCPQLHDMLAYSKTYNVPISVELEKHRDDYQLILPFADIILISKPFAESANFNSATDCLQSFSAQFPDKIITCTWGDQGAWAYVKSDIIHQPALNISSIIETLGAGDTFNAGFIAAQLHKKNVRDSLLFACQLAANKCQQAGFDNLVIPPLTGMNDA